MFSKLSPVIGPRVFIRAALPALFSIGVIWLLFDVVSAVDFATALGAVRTYAVSTWAMAAAFTLISFCAVSRYDPVATEILGLNIPKRRAISMGWKATAISQLAGFGLITGTIIRWLELSNNPNRSEKHVVLDAFKLTVLVSLCFLTGWAIVTLVTSGTLLMPAVFAAIVVLVAGLGAATWHHLPLAWRCKITNSYRPAIGLITLALVDTLFAALALNAFLPPEIAPFTSVFLAFLLSYTVGLVSGLPGGLGPFEISMLMLLPDIEPTLLAPALIGFRVIYFAIPASVAASCLAVQLLTSQSRTSATVTAQTVPKSLRRAAPPEADLIAVSSLSCLTTSDQSEAAIALHTRFSLIQLGDPFGRLLPSSNILKSLQQEAQWSRRAMAIYRCNRLTASRAEGLGLKAFQFSAEAILIPKLFDMNVPSRSGLRRKIRKAKKAGITINSQPLNMPRLDDIDRNWSAVHRVARGFSTGRFSAALIGRQRIYVAYRRREPVGFITFSTAQNQWQLDLIRYQDDCPDGTIYALVARAIEDARMEGILHLSLGSVPFCPATSKSDFADKMHRLVFARSPALKGLYQFKKTFDPEWHDRYIVISSITGGFVATLSILRAIFSQGPRRKLSHPS